MMVLGISRNKRQKYGCWLILIFTLSLIIIFKLNFLLVISTESKPSSTLEVSNIQDTLLKIRNFLNSDRHNVARELSNFNNTDLIYNKIIVEENVDNLIKIGELLKKKKANAEHSRDLPSKNIDTKQTKKLIHIKGWEPFYVDEKLEGAINDKSQESEIDRLLESIENWDPFYIKFPDEQSQDAILVHFKLSDSIVEELIHYVKKFEVTRKTVELPKPEYLNLYQDEQETLLSWKLFHQKITQYQLYSLDDPLFKTVIHEMQTLPFTEAEQPERGTQQKILYHLSNGLRVMFKPRRFPRGQEANPDLMFWREYERHYAEIAAFHLDMVFEFYRVPPTVGRYISVQHDIEDLDEKGEIHFFWSPAGNRCFYGKCRYYCDTGHAICGRPDRLEGSFMMYTPSKRFADRDRLRSPWRREYSETDKADWFYEYDYCQKVRKTPPYDTGRKLLDVMDLAVFDFIAGNMDRHHHEFFEDFGNYTIPVLYDNGRGFGKSKHDDLTILAPLYQCCLVRFTTLKKLLAFHKGPIHISDAMRESLKEDLASPVLTETMLSALDRRVAMILRTVYQCIAKHGYDKVVKDDGI